MYAAAGGASIASRQARQKQRQKKAAATLEKSKGPKAAAALKAAQSKVNLAASAPQSKAFHNLPSNYQSGKPKSGPAAVLGADGKLRTPHTVASHRRNSSNVHPHLHLKPSETVAGHLSKAKSTHKIHHSQSCMFASKHPESEYLHVVPDLPDRKESIADVKSGLTVPVQSDEVLLGSDGKPLERRCSVRQHRQQDHQTDHHYTTDDNQHYLSYDNQNQLNQMRGYNEDRPRWDIMYGDEKYDCSSLDFPFSECSQGRAAWQERERERRGSLTEAALNHRSRQTEAHLRWMKRNRIHDASYGGSSDEEDILGGLYGHQSAAANALLYVGLGTVAIGAVIFFVGTGEKGFKTLELRLIGPTLVGCGFLCCLVRILLCVCPSRCFHRKKRKRCRHMGGGGGGGAGGGGLGAPPMHGAGALAAGIAQNSIRRYQNESDHNTLLKKPPKKRVSIAQGPYRPPVPSTSQQLAYELVPIPKIQVPNLIEVSEISDNKQLPKAESIIELQNLDMYEDDLSSVSSDDQQHQQQPENVCKVDIVNNSESKITRKREPLNQTSNSLIMETSLSIPLSNNVHNDATASSLTEIKTSPGEIVLSPSKLGQ